MKVKKAMKTIKTIVLHRCTKCEKEFDVTGSIKISITNPWHVYQGSGRPLRYNKNARLCKKHFKEFRHKLEKLINEY